MSTKQLAWTVLAVFIGIWAYETFGARLSAKVGV